MTLEIWSVLVDLMRDAGVPVVILQILNWIVVGVAFWLKYSTSVDNFESNIERVIGIARSRSRAIVRLLVSQSLWFFANIIIAGIAVMYWAELPEIQYSPSQLFAAYQHLSILFLLIINWWSIYRGTDLPNWMTFNAMFFGVVILAPIAFKLFWVNGDVADTLTICGLYIIWNRLLNWATTAPATLH